MTAPDRAKIADAIDPRVRAMQSAASPFDGHARTVVVHYDDLIAAADLLRASPTATHRAAAEEINDLPLRADDATRTGNIEKIAAIIARCAQPGFAEGIEAAAKVCDARLAIESDKDGWQAACIEGLSAQIRSLRP